jgi:hypothetical protein
LFNLMRVQVRYSITGLIDAWLIRELIRTEVNTYAGPTAHIVATRMPTLEHIMTGTPHCSRGIIGRA